MSLDDVLLHRVENTDDVADFLTWLGERREFLAVDTETSGLNRGCDYIRLCQFGDSRQGWALDWSDWKGVCREAIHKYEGRIVCHNLLYDSSMLKKEGVLIPQAQADDTMIMVFLKDTATRMDLKGAAARYVDRRAEVGKGLLAQAMSAGGWDWATVPTDLPAYWTYGVLDTCLTAMLAEKLWPEINANYREAYELELANIHCLREAELAGLLVDEEYRLAACAKLEAELAELRPQIPCKPSSDKQVIAYLQSLGVPLFELTEKGNLSVDKDVLDYFREQFPVCGTIREWKTRDRFLNNYLYKFGDLAVDGVLRASTRPVAARTGRTSVTDPPLQQLPRGRVVRDAIIARPGCRLVMADFAGMEMRAFASEAEEQNMLAAYARGEDLHDFAARAIYGEGFTKQHRTLAKNTGFCLIYGGGPGKIATTAKVPVETATAFLEQYLQLFPRVKPFMEHLTQSIYTQAGGRRGRGSVTLFDGRRIVVDADKAYTSVNYTIQGGTAVAVKKKIVELDAAGLGDYFRLAVHDEIIFEVPDVEVAAAEETIRQVMPDRHSYKNVVLEIDQDTVQRWGQHYRHDYPKFIDTPDPEWLAA